MMTLGDTLGSGIHPAYVAALLGLIGVSASILNSWLLKAKTKKAKKTVLEIASLIAQLICFSGSAVFAFADSFGASVGLTWLGTLIFTVEFLLGKELKDRGNLVALIFLVGLSFWITSVHALNLVIDQNKGILRILEKHSEILDNQVRPTHPKQTNTVSVP